MSKLQRKKFASVKDASKVNIQEHRGKTFTIINMPEFTDISEIVDLWEDLKKADIKLEVSSLQWITPEVLDGLLALRKLQMKQRVSTGMFKSGKPIGRPIDIPTQQKAVAMYKSKEYTGQQIIDILGISRSRLYRYVKQK